VYSHPSPDDMIESVLIALQKDIAPECMSERAQVAILMAQAVLQSARQLIPVMQQYMAQEHNEMLGLYGELAKVLEGSSEPEAAHIREMAADVADRAPLPEIPPYDEIVDAHDKLAQGLVDIMRDLDVLIRGGNQAAEEALIRFRAAMGPRIARDFGTIVVGAGMAGRG